eukprot:SAG22_NODE_96_length_20771_cov_33.186018_6_plen_295_part_00
MRGHQAAARRRLSVLSSSLARSHPPCSATSSGSGGGATVTEDARAITIDTPQLSAVIPKNNPTHWMTGIEKHSFVDKATSAREIGDGLMVIDWLMEAGSDEAYAGDFDRRTGIAAPGGDSGGTAVGSVGTDRYLWHDASWVVGDPVREEGARMAHGTSHRKRAIEGPQLCHRMGPVEPTVIRGPGFVAIETKYIYEYAAPGKAAGSTWTQLIVFPEGERFFILMDQVTSANDSDALFLRNDTPGCVRHVKGDTFSEMYLSHLDGPASTGHVLIPSAEFFEPFPPDLKFGYRRDM